MLTKFFNAITDFFYSLFMSLLEGLKDIIFWFFELILSLITGVLDGLTGMLGQLDVSQYLGAVPPTVAWVFVQSGIPNALSIISVAIGIRLVLQLVPFVRLGS